MNRVAEVYASLRIEQVQSAEQAALVCELLGCDALVVPTVTAYDPYNPPKFGASLQLFRKPAGYGRPEHVDPRELSRAPRAGAERVAAARRPDVRAGGRHVRRRQRLGPRRRCSATPRAATTRSGRWAPKSISSSMDRYCGFVYHELIGELLESAMREDDDVKLTSERGLRHHGMSVWHVVTESFTGINVGARMSDMKTLSLVKGKQHFCFRYEVGRRRRCSTRWSKWSTGASFSFDWFDAAVAVPPARPAFGKRIEGVFAEESSVRRSGSHRSRPDHRR